MTRPPFTGGLGIAVYGGPEDQARVEELLVRGGAKIVHRHVRKTSAGQRPVIELTLTLPEEAKP